jgi:chaperonin GroEL (HSP60 family)
MDKMLVDSVGDITVTNDGVTILDKMEIEHPAAKMMVEISKTQEAEVGDGTTTAVMLAGKLLENAEKLLDMKVHPTIITKGYNLAAEKAREFLQELCFDFDHNDEILKNVVKTAMTGKGAETFRDNFSEIVVSAVKQINDNGKIDLQNIRVVKNKSKGVEDTKLIKGLIRRFLLVILLNYKNLLIGKIRCLKAWLKLLSLVRLMLSFVRRVLMILCNII